MATPISYDDVGGIAFIISGNIDATVVRLETSLLVILPVKLMKNVILKVAGWKNMMQCV